LGLADGRIRTLEEVGKVVNLTRERVRQIEKKAKETAKSYSAYLPRCRAAVRILRSLGGIANESELVAAMRDKQSARSRADLSALVARGELGWGPEVTEVDGYWSVVSDARSIIRSVRDAVYATGRDDIGTSFGLAAVSSALRRQGSQVDIRLVRSVARGLPGFVDLGDDFFARAPGKGAVARHLMKILQASGPIGEGTLLRAFQREPRFKRIPRQIVFHELVHNAGFQSVVGKWSVTGEMPRVEPRHSEDVATRILRDRGPMLGPELLDAVRGEGVGESSAKVVISQSSLIQKWPRNVYTHIGARPTAGEIADALARRVRRKRHLEVVHQRDGKIKITADYGGFESSGALSLGSRAQLDGDWDGQATGAYRHRVRSGKGFVWGFGSWLRRERFMEGEFFSLTFDPADRTVWFQREAPPPTNL
jgi:hypothetical protein